MQPLWTILAPIDLSNDAEIAVEHAINAANAFTAELVLLYVVEPCWSRTAPRPGWPPNARAASHSDVERVVLPGRPATTIARYAEFINADLLLMTTRRHSQRP